MTFGAMKMFLTREPHWQPGSGLSDWLHWPSSAVADLHTCFGPQIWSETAAGRATIRMLLQCGAPCAAAWPPDWNISSVTPLLEETSMQNKVPTDWTAIYFLFHFCLLPRPPLSVASFSWDNFVFLHSGVHLFLLPLAVWETSGHIAAHNTPK